MKTTLRIFLAAISLAAFAFSQNTRVDDIVLTRGGMPAPGAQIAVCSQPANTTTAPCSPLAPLCSSLTDTVCNQPNPITADGLGNYFFYIKPGFYTRQFYGSGLTTRVQVDNAFISPGLPLYVDQFPGSTGGAKLKACIAFLLSAGGTCDARGFSSTIQTIAAADCPINVGTATKQVSLLFDPSGRWNVNCSGGSATFAMAEGSSMDCTTGDAISGGGGGGFYLASGANVSSLVENAVKDGTQEAMRINGCLFQGTSTATVLNALVWAKLLSVQTVISNNVIIVNMNAVGLLSDGNNSVYLPNNSINGNAGTNSFTSSPMQIIGCSSQGANVTIIGGAIEHSGVGKPILRIDGASGSNASGPCNAGTITRSIHIYGTHFETESGTNGIEINNAVDVSIVGADAQRCCSGVITGTDWIKLSGLTDQVELVGVNNGLVEYTNTVNDTTVSNVNTVTAAQATLLPFYIKSSTMSRLSNVNGNAFQFRPGNTFSTLATCIAGLEGLSQSISDSTTAVWGANIAGGGANHVLAYCDGTNWTVAAK